MVTEASADTRTRLIDAAVDTFLEYGYAGTRVQDIARRADLTTGAMYAHFENKADLLGAAIAERGREALEGAVARIGDDELGLLGVTVSVDLLTGPLLAFHRLILEALAVAARGEESDTLIGPTLELLHEALQKQAAAGRRAGLIDESITDEALTGLFERLFLGSIVAKAVTLPALDKRETEHLLATMLSALPPQEPRG